MLKNKKAKGTLFEHRVRDFFERRGCFVIRQASSAFPDLIVITPNEELRILINFPSSIAFSFRNNILCIECKVTGKISGEEVRGLKNLKNLNSNIRTFRAYPLGSAYSVQDGNICLDEVE